MTLECEGIQRSLIAIISKQRIIKRTSAPMEENVNKNKYHVFSLQNLVNSYDIQSMGLLPELWRICLLFT